MWKVKKKEEDDTNWFNYTKQPNKVNILVKKTKKI